MRGDGATAREEGGGRQRDRPATVAGQVRGMLSPKTRQARKARSKSLVMGEQSQSLGRSPGPHRPGPVLKAGWLKKQRSIVRTWQRRWFVLRGDQLFYYKDKGETKAQGFISLQGTQVTELLPGPEDLGKHLFEISPGGAGEQEKIPANHEAFLLMASSQSDMEDWVRAIRRVIWAPLGRGTARRSHACPLEPLPPGIFGQHLEDTVHHERKYGPRQAPLLVEQCVDFLRERGLTEEGLFRMPGQASLVRDLQDSFDCGEKPLFDRFLDEVQSHSDVNKMSVQNLATVFGPNILRPQVEDPVTLMEGTSLVQHLMTVLIRRHSQLFTATATVGPASPHRGPQRTVGWGSEEVTKDSQGDPGSPGAPGLPSQRASSLDGATVVALTRASPSGLAATSSGKRVQILPNWRSSSQQSGSRPASPKAGSSALEMPAVSCSGNWLMNGLSSLRGHRRASSEDRLRDYSSSQRLSTYDNVPPPGLLPSSPSVASTAWSRAASSGEASARGSVSSCTACRASDSSARSSLHTEWALEPSPLPSSSEEHRSSDLGHSLDEAGTGLSMSGPSSPGQDLTCGPEALQGLVTELRAELCRQRTEYEASVRRLEKGSADLKKCMSQLEEELDQERKKYMMLEIKLRNSERAREDAEKRNQVLQKEMEEFFSTLGSLTVGAKGAGAPQ
ncbi:rho GTPase-activating protein 22 isoform X3 [Elephas maximus indicus]|uniref:rho GTPase-activating protein 22 isoform X3 n=1 Tax=Elephas maximus indicus TaxID=99487 RepID=UPI002116BE86|nr:rho GTPase-activating protein 22 isoform X3 [Elephas maximus indicus]